MSRKEQQTSKAQQGATRRNNIFSGERAIDRFLRSRKELSQRQRNAVELLLRGLSDEETAAQIGVDRGTIFRWRKSIAFQREIDRQRRLLWQQSAAELQSMVAPALGILRKQLSSDDQKVAMRAAAVLLRFATPSRLAPAAMREAPPDSPRAMKAKEKEEKEYVDDLIAYIDAPLPGEPGAPGTEEFDDEER